MSPLVIAFFTFFLGVSASLGQQLTWKDAPETHTLNPEIFRQLIQNSKNSTVHILVIGDSQETCPEGRGDVYIPSLNYELFLRAGNSPATPYVSVFGSYGGGQPHADYLVRGALAQPQSVTSSRLEASAILPGIFPGKSCLLNCNNANNNQCYGELLMLQTHADNIHPETKFANATTFFNSSGGVFLDLLCATNQLSGGVILKFSVNPSSFNNYYSPSIGIASGNENLSNAPNGVSRYVHEIFGPILYDTSKNLQVEIGGSSAVTPTDIVAARFLSAADIRGWAITDLSAGGYNSRTILDNHSNSFPMLSALRPDVIFLAYGANDSQIFSPSDYSNNIETLISTIRVSIGYDIPIILIADVYRETLSAFQKNNIDSYPYVCYQLSSQLPNVMAMNSRKLTENIGWREYTSSSFLADGVHYTPLGGRSKAQLEVASLYRNFDMCPADYNGDGSLDFFDYDNFIYYFSVGSLRSDFNGDRSLDFFDYDDYVFAFEIGC